MSLVYKTTKKVITVQKTVYETTDGHQFDFEFHALLWERKYQAKETIKKITSKNSNGVKYMFLQNDNDIDALQTNYNADEKTVQANLPCWCTVKTEGMEDDYGMSNGTKLVICQMTYKAILDILGKE